MISGPLILSSWKQRTYVIAGILLAAVLPGRWSALAPAVALGLWFASQLLPGLVEARVPVVFRLLPLYAGLIAAALGWRTRRFHEATGYRWFFLATPVAWTALDFVRGAQAPCWAGRGATRSMRCGRIRRCCSRSRS